VTDGRWRGVCSDELPVRTAKLIPAPTRHGLLPKPHRLLAVSAVLVAGVLLADCGGDEAATEEDSNTIARSNTVEVAGADRLSFEPNEFTIPAGQEVTLKLTAGSVEHDFVVEGATAYGTAEADHQAGDDLHVAHADAGETVTAMFRIDKAGTYTVYCSVSGHRDAGMVASLEVIDAQG
jgi:uncharacterized cupredoxin-like copper-binding protein